MDSQARTLSTPSLAPSQASATPLLASKIEMFPPGSLVPRARNARTHSRKQIRQIADSIEQFGFTNPILIDGERGVLAGHGRLEAAKLLGLAEVPCIRLEHLSDVERRAYVLADNKLALNAGWDEDLLALELRDLSALDLGFDLSLTGFSIPEIDSLVLDTAEPDGSDPAADVLPTTVATRCQPGDLWQLGPHRLICGDSLDIHLVDRLMAGDKARMTFTDPPYNVPVDGHVSGLGKVKHAEFAMASGEMSEAQFTEFLRQSFAQIDRHSLNGAIAYICMDWRHMGEVLAAGKAVFADYKNLIVWAKDNGGMGTFYRSRHELIFVFKSGTAPHTNSFELGQHGRYRTNVWQYKGANSFQADREGLLAMHPTVKPVRMVADAIRDVSARGEIVLDLFGGSGSTLIAAHKVGRIARICEIDPVYCDRIIARYEAFAHDRAELIGSHQPGQTPSAGGRS